MNTNDFVKQPQQAWCVCYGKRMVNSTPLRIERRMFGKHRYPNLYPDYDEQARFYIV